MPQVTNIFRKGATTLHGGRAYTVTGVQFVRSAPSGVLGFVGGLDSPLTTVVLSLMAEKATNKSTNKGKRIAGAHAKGVASKAASEKYDNPYTRPNMAQAFEDGFQGKPLAK